MADYMIKKITDYTGAIVEHIQGIAPALPNRYRDWQQHLQAMDRAHDAFQGQQLRLGLIDSEERKQQLLDYANAVRNAAYFAYLSLRWDYRETALIQNDFNGLKEHLESLKTAYRAVYPKGEIKSPLPALDCSNNLDHIELGTTRDPENYDRFINSSQFRSLETYLNTCLHEDTRDHSFLGVDLSEKRKPAVLAQIIRDLREFSSLDQVRTYLEDFYSREEKFGTKLDSSSRYDVLNLGQNITTRFFSVFGKQTTTIELIDQLATSIGINPIAVTHNAVI